VPQTPLLSNGVLKQQLSTVLPLPKALIQVVTDYCEIATCGFVFSSNSVVALAEEAVTPRGAWKMQQELAKYLERFTSCFGNPFVSNAFIALIEEEGKFSDIEIIFSSLREIARKSPPNAESDVERDKWVKLSFDKSNYKSLDRSFVYTFFSLLGIFPPPMKAIISTK